MSLNFVTPHVRIRRSHQLFFHFQPRLPPSCSFPITSLELEQSTFLPRSVSNTLSRTIAQARSSQKLLSFAKPFSLSGPASVDTLTLLSADFAETISVHTAILLSYTLQLCSLVTLLSALVILEVVSELLADGRLDIWGTFYYDRLPRKRRGYLAIGARRLSKS